MKAIVGLLLLATVSCHTTTGSAPPTQPPGPPCSSLTRRKDVTAATFNEPCTVDAATAQITRSPIGTQLWEGTLRMPCQDHRVLFWNDLGWGYENQWFALHPVDGERLPPQDATKRCAGNV